MIKREAEGRLLRLWREFPVVLVSGARQVGKTTLVDMLSDRLRLGQRISFDHSGSRQRANEDPELFIEGARLPAFLDEAQKSPAVFDAIKQQVDRHRRPGRFLLSGSANFLLLKRVSESLAGRASRLFLRGLSLRERMSRVGDAPHLLECLKARTARRALDQCHATADRVHLSPRDLSQHLLEGRFPELVARRRSEAFRLAWLEAYVDAFVEKDLPDFGEIRHREEFRRVWRLVAASAAQLRDLASFGQALGVSYHTVDRYLGLLEQGCHLFRLEPYYVNIGKRLTKTPKIFSEDTGLALMLAGIRGLEQLEASDRRGAWLENFAIAEMKTLTELFDPSIQLWFWRTLAGAEVDLLVERGARLLPIEIKWSSRPTRSECKGLETLLSDLKPRAPFGIVACGTREPFLVTDRIVAVPLPWLLI
ncbi:MAG: ATP-binding protein [Candidatus Omnitrophota bacterium]|nr:ATP-binding protein [Candidatus Omnitrophota bacterium]